MGIADGNQTALMFVYYLITRWKELGKINGKEYIVKTIVTTELIRTIAEKNGVEVYDVYTGFKWIADVMKKNEERRTISVAVKKATASYAKISFATKMPFLLVPFWLKSQPGRKTRVSRCTSYYRTSTFSMVSLKKKESPL